MNNIYFATGIALLIVGLALAIGIEVKTSNSGIGVNVFTALTIIAGSMLIAWNRTL